MALACLMPKHSLANGRNEYMKAGKPQAQEFAFCCSSSASSIWNTAA